MDESQRREERVSAQLRYLREEMGLSGAVARSADIARVLGLSSADALRMRIRRGTCPVRVTRDGAEYVALVRDLAEYLARLEES